MYKKRAGTLLHRLFNDFNICIDIFGFYSSTTEKSMAAILL